MSRSDSTDDWILEDLAAITGKDIKELRKTKVRTKSTPVNRHKYFRRPGKRHNNDFCFSCREGGTLICCDGCTKSFHLLCLDPPMEDEDIPEGEWLCKTCKLGKKQLPDGVFSLKFLSRKRKRSIEDDGTEDTKEAKLIRSVWSQLIRKAVEGDPKEYENPLDCRTIPYIFPGDSKNTKKNQFKLKHPHSTQCYICRKGLAKQSMINCDYCERSFHLDCTDPPLTTPPKYFWMCQFHIEPCLERIFYQEEIPSLSQRIALWDMCRKPIDQESIKLEFLRNLITDPSKTVQLPTTPVEIPDAVYHHYNNRPDMIPSLKEALRLVGYNQSVDYLHKIPPVNKPIDDPQYELKTLKEEQELWLASVVGFQKEVVAKLNRESINLTVTGSSRTLHEEIQDAESETSDKDETAPEKQSDSCDTSSVSSKGSCRADRLEIRKPHDELSKVLAAAVAQLPEASECLNIMNYLDEDFINVLAFQRLCQLLNYNKIRDALTENKDLYEKLKPPDPSEATRSLIDFDLEKFIGDELEKTRDKDVANEDTIVISDGEIYQKISKYDFKSYLDIESDETDISQLIPSQDEGKKCEEENLYGEDEDLNITDFDENKINKDDLFSRNTLGNDCLKVTTSHGLDFDRPTDIIKFPSYDGPVDICSKNKIYGILTCVDKQTELFPILKSGFVIGKGSSVHLDLDKCGRCNFVSNYHAVIYFDCRTQLWEIINYSRFGTRVNNVLLSFDIPKKSLQNILDQDSRSEICFFHKSIKTIAKQQLAEIDGEKAKTEQEEGLKEFLKDPCQCDASLVYSNMASNGWNNSVPFGHGSLLRFGCISLVFGDPSYVS